MDRISASSKCVVRVILKAKKYHITHITWWSSTFVFAYVHVLFCFPSVGISLLRIGVSLSPSPSLCKLLSVSLFLLIFDYLIVPSPPHSHSQFPFFFLSSLASFILTTLIPYTSSFCLPFPFFYTIFSSANFYSKYSY